MRKPSQRRRYEQTARDNLPKLPSQSQVKRPYWTAEQQANPVFERWRRYQHRAVWAAAFFAGCLSVQMGYLTTHRPRHPDPTHLLTHALQNHGTVFISADDLFELRVLLATAATIMLLVALSELPLRKRFPPQRK